MKPQTDCGRWWPIVVLSVTFVAQASYAPPSCATPPHTMEAERATNPPDNGTRGPAASDNAASHSGDATHRGLPNLGLDSGISLQRPLTDSWVLASRSEYERTPSLQMYQDLPKALAVASRQRQEDQVEVAVDLDQDGAVDWWVYYKNETPVFGEADRFQAGCRDLRVDLRKTPWKFEKFQGWIVEPPVPMPGRLSLPPFAVNDAFDWAVPDTHSAEAPNSSSMQIARALFPDLKQALARLAEASPPRSTARDLRGYADRASLLHERFIKVHKREGYAQKLQFSGGWRKEYVPYDVNGDGTKEIVVAFSPFGIDDIQFCKKVSKDPDDWMATVVFERGRVVRIDIGAERYLSLDRCWTRVSSDSRNKITAAYLLPGYRHYRAGNWYQAMMLWRHGALLAALLGDVSIGKRGQSADGFADIVRGFAMLSAADLWQNKVEGLPAHALLLIARNLGWRHPFEGFHALAAQSLEAGQPQEALALFHLSLRFDRKQGSSVGQVNTLEAMSKIYVQLGNFDRAIDCLFESLDVESTLDYALEIAENLPNLTRDIDEAKAIRAQAMALNRGCKLGAIAALYAELNEPNKAKGYLLEAERILTLVDHEHAKADIETIKAKWDMEKGSWELARDRLHKALKVAMRQSNDLEERASHTFFLSEPHENIQIRMASPSHPLSYRANIVGMIAETYIAEAVDIGPDDKVRYDQSLKTASEWQEKALQWYREARNNAGVLSCQLRLAAIALHQNEYDAALHLARRVAEKAADQNVFEAVWRAHAMEGAVQSARGNVQAAIDCYERAAKQVESVRRLNRSETARRGLLGSKHAIYEELSLLYHLQGQHEAAWLCIERGKARTLLDVLAGHDIRPKGDEVVEIQEARPALFDRLFGQFAASAAAPAEPATGADYFEAIRARPDVNEVVSLGAVNPVALTDVQQCLEDGVLLVEYFATRDSLLAAIVSREEVHTVLIPGYGHERLNEDVVAIRKCLQSPRSPYKHLASRLYNDLLRPCLDGASGVRHVCVVPSGALNYLPFHALVSEDGRFVIETTMISYAPSASALCFARAKSRRLQEGTQTSALIVAAASATSDFPALPYGEQSGRTIADLWPEPATLLLNEEATETNVKTQLSSSGVFHFEGHADLHPNRPMQSALILREDIDNDGRLEVEELFSIRAPKCRLAVLAACETRMGQWSHGDEMVGLTRAFLRAGVPTVVASVWKIQDKSSAQLMVRFHQLLAQKQVSRLAALTTAQREFLAGKVAQLHLPEPGDLHPTSENMAADGQIRGRPLRVQDSTPRQQPATGQNRHPYYWAGLELIGDWN